jgi:hypothetical protein
MENRLRARGQLKLAWPSMVGLASALLSGATLARRSLCPMHGAPGEIAFRQKCSVQLEHRGK